MYSDPPWIFTGRALYQLQLVKSEEARKRIPEALKLVEAFGHTLGGFYLARYDDSPVGSFDELVALTGLVWNAPTSCAWAARVYVNNKEARDHGLDSVGLPSRIAEFREAPSSDDDQKARLRERKRKHGLANWWRQGKAPAQAASTKGVSSNDQVSSEDASYLQGFPNVQVWNTERTRGRSLRNVPVCTFTSLPAALCAGGHGLGPRIRMFLPSFSGGTLEHPGLLKYSCDLRTNVRLLPPARVLLPNANETGMHSSSSSGSSQSSSQSSSGICLPEERGELMHAVLGGKPLITMAFDNMEMRVEAPLKLELPAVGPPMKPAAAAFSAGVKSTKK